MAGVSSSDDAVEFGPFSVDRKTGELKKDGRSIRLSRQARTLLGLLVARAGDVVTREQIQSALWPDGTTVDFDQSINFCVTRVRAALGDAAAHPRYIETVAGTGYRFLVPVQRVRHPRRRPKRGIWAAGSALAMLGLAAYASYKLSPGAVRLPRVSVPPFENRTGDPELDWLRLGISEMLTTDLAESGEIELTRGDADTVVRGAFVRVGERVRIDAHLEEKQTETIVGSEKVEGRIETDLLGMLDELSARLRLRLESEAVGAGPDLASITTSSVEAYRFYIEGRARSYKGEFTEAVPNFEEALRLDPEFATAMVSLAAVEGLLGTEVERGRWAGSVETVNAHWERRRALTERAFELSHRLPGRERFYIEGQYHRIHGEDARAIDAYEKAISLYPDHLMARLNLAARYDTHHEHEKTIEQLQEIRKRSVEFRIGGTRFLSLERYLAGSYTALGRIEEARALLESLVERFPDDPESHRAWGEHLIVSGNLDAAQAALDRSRRLRKDGRTPIEMCAVHILREEWEEAETLAGDNAWHRAVLRLYRGRAAEALADLDSIAGYERIYVGWPSAYLTETLLQLDRPAKVLEFETEPVLRAMALARLGKLDEANAQARPFRGSRTPLARRFDHLLEYEVARARGDAARAIQALGWAEASLSPRRTPTGETPQHVPVWYRLATAHLAAGRLEEAEGWFLRITESPSERLPWPIPYVRSFYLLAKIHEERGEIPEARALYRQFHEYWKDGDLDRAWVDEAGKRAGL